MSNQRNYKFLYIYFSDIFGRTCQLYSATFNRTLYGTFLSGVIVVKSSSQLLFFSRGKNSSRVVLQFYQCMFTNDILWEFGLFFILVIFVYLLVNFNISLHKHNYRNNNWQMPKLIKAGVLSFSILTVKYVYIVLNYIYSQNINRYYIQVHYYKVRNINLSANLLFSVLLWINFLSI